VVKNNSKEKKNGASREISVVFGFSKYQPQRKVKMLCALHVLGGSKFTQIHKVGCHLPP